MTKYISKLRTKIFDGREITYKWEVLEKGDFYLFNPKGSWNGMGVNLTGEVPVLIGEYPNTTHPMGYKVYSIKPLIG